MLTGKNDISELLTDMTMKGATEEEIKCMINYSLKVIDLKLLYCNLGIEELV